MKKRRRTSHKLYRSLLEAKVVPVLLRLGGEYEMERIAYTSRHEYIPDVTMPNGIRIELKGYFDADDRRKMRELKEQHPEIDIRIVFQRASTKLSKASKTTYGAWATKHGYKWCEAKDVHTMRRWANETTRHPGTEDIFR
jgi:hypothetical protein